MVVHRKLRIEHPGAIYHNRQPTSRDLPCVEPTLVSNVATNSRAAANYFENGSGSSFTLLAIHNEGGAAFTYHPNAPMQGPPTSSTARPTIALSVSQRRRVPREPRDVHRASGPWSPPANRVRSAAASGYVADIYHRECLVSIVRTDLHDRQPCHCRPSGKITALAN